MKKCLHCERSVEFISGKGYVHMPEGRAYVMEHAVMRDAQLARYNFGMAYKRGKGCGWVGVQPADVISLDTDICPSCGAQGELSDNHIASPSRENAILDKIGECSFPDKCQKAEWKQCDCSCGGANHGIQIRMFTKIPTF